MDTSTVAEPSSTPQGEPDDNEDASSAAKGPTRAPAMIRTPSLRQAKLYKQDLDPVPRAVDVHITVPDDFFHSLPEHFRNGDGGHIKVTPVMFSQGVNEFQVRFCPTRALCTFYTILSSVSNAIAHTYAHTDGCKSQERLQPAD